MRIVFLHHAFQIGSGIDQVILELASRLRLIGHNTIVVTYSDGYEPQNTIPVAEFRLPTSKMPGPVGRILSSVLAPAFTGTNRDIRDMISGSDIVITSLYPMSIIPLWPRKIESKVIFIEWGIQPYSAFGSLVDKGYLWILNRADRYVIKRSDKVLVANNITKRWVENQGILPIKLDLYGINFDRLNINADYKCLYSKHKELADAEGVILYAGRQSPHKNIELLISSVALLKRRGYNTILLIVGRESFPGYAKRLRVLAHELNLDNNIIFTGLVSEKDLARYYNLCDLFVNASRWEGFLNPEPYAFKKPIIAYNIPPHDETVQDGVTGMLVSSLTPDGFAQKIEYLLDNKEKRLKMGEAGYRWARENLDYGIIAPKFVNVIED